jgi:hypothetical protein
LKKLTHQNQSEYVVENLKNEFSNLNPLIYFYELMHSVQNVQEWDLSTSSRQAATQMLKSEQKFERSVATGDAMKI